jgi:hypothetical protein
VGTIKRVLTRGFCRPHYGLPDDTTVLPTGTFSIYGSAVVPSTDCAKRRGRLSTMKRTVTMNDSEAETVQNRMIETFSSLTPQHPRTQQ